MIKLESAENQHLLFNLMQKYLYEMSAYYGNTMDDSGNFEYKYLPLYFSEPDRHAYFFWKDAIIIGFALVNEHSFTGESIDHSLAEFTIFPAHRNRGYGMKAMECLIRELPGKWQLKYSVANKPGIQFWKKLQEKYNGSETILNESEIAITLNS